LDQVINHGYLAVDFFFVFSGFVVGYAYDDRWNKMTIGAFFLQLFCEEFARLFQFPIVVKIQHAIDFAERQQNLRIASRILVEDGQ